MTSETFAWDLRRAPSFNFKKFELGSHVPGSQIEAIVVIENHLVDPIVLDRVVPNCKCTRGQVPQGTLKPGDSVSCTFTFDTPRSPKKLDEYFVVDIHTTGPEKLLHLSFHVEWKDFVAFVQPELTVYYFPENQENRFEIPIMSRAPSDLEGIKIEASDELKAIKTTIAERNGRYVVEGVLAGSDFERLSSTMGELRLVTTKNYRASVSITVSRSQPLEIMPMRVVFVATNDEGYIRRGTVIVRSRSSDNSNKPNPIKSIECKASNGAILNTRAIQLSDEVHKVDVFLRKRDQLASDDLLHWNCGTSSGARFSLESKVFIGN